MQLRENISDIETNNVRINNKAFFHMNDKKK